MAGLEKPKYFDFGRDKGKFAKEYVDKLLPFMPDYGGFFIYDIIDKSDLNDIDKEKAKQLYHEIRTILTEQINYAYEKRAGERDIFLNDKGQSAKNPIIENSSDKKDLLSVNATNVVFGNNHGNLTTVDNQSSLPNFETNLPTKAPNAPTNIMFQNEKWYSKILSSNWTIAIIGGTIAAIIAAYFVFIFKWNH